MSSVVVLLAALLGPTDGAQQDAFDRAAEALARGLRAERAGDHAGERAAARELRFSEALPVNAEEDAADRWDRHAGARPAAPDRGAALGPGYRLLSLGAGATVALERTFLAGQRARVAIAPGPAAIFALTVTEDGEERPVCAASTTRTRCDWVPLYTQRFAIRLTNRGRLPTRFYLVVQ